VTPKAYGRFPELRAMDLPKNPVAVGLFVSPKGRAVELTSRNPMWVVSRKDLDARMRALSAGWPWAEHASARVVGVQRAPGGWDVHAETGGRAFVRRFAFVVGADGALSRVRRDVLSPIPKAHLAITGGYFVKAAESVARTQFLAEGGYLWTFPRMDHVCVGGGAGIRGWKVFEHVDAFRRQYYPDAPVLAKWGAPIPFVKDPAFYSLPTSGDGWALCGDAAGHVDAVTGEGILYALWGADVLADALLSDAPRTYEARWRDHFGRDLRRAATASRSFYARGAMERIFHVAQRSATLRALLMDLMADQPSYRETAQRFRRRLPRIALEALGVVR
jgi:flavin-dependent dehydrogenase